MALKHRPEAQSGEWGQQESGIAWSPAPPSELWSHAYCLPSKSRLSLAWPNQQTALPCGGLNLVSPTMLGDHTKLLYNLELLFYHS